MEPHDNDAPDLDYPQLRDQIIDALRALRVGISIDPFNSPTQAHDQIPLLAGALSGVLDLRSMAAIDPDVLAHFHQLSRRAITLATAALDSAEAHLRTTDYDIDTRN